MYTNKPTRTRDAIEIREEQQLIEIYKIIYSAFGIVFLGLIILLLII